MTSGVKRTHAEFVQLLKAKPFGEDIILLSSYKAEKQKIKCMCRKCGYIWDTTPKTLLSGIGCKACNNIDVLEGYNDLATVDPELASEWDYANNKLTPTEVLPGSKMKANWICAQGHRWSAVIYDRHTKKTKCPYCSGKYPIVGETDFATLHPDIAAEWDYEKNAGLSPSDFTEKSSKKVWWICEFGHEWQAPIYSRSNGIGCPKCAKERQTSFPEQAVLFYVSKAGFMTDDQFKFGSYRADIFLPEINTVIEYDGERWHRNKVDKDNKKDQFYISHGYSVIRIRELGLPPTERATNLFYQPQTGGNVNLDNVIKECLASIGCRDLPFSVDTMGDYDEIIKQAISSKKENSLEKEHPELLTYWDYKRNDPIHPDMVSSGSGTIVSWRCPTCGYEFRRSIQSMVTTKSCPVCVGKSGLVKLGVNDFLTNAPELEKEWDYSKNTVDPNEVSINNSTRKIWWKCSLGHSWQARIVDRVNQGTGCPYCANKKVLSGYNDLLSKCPEIAQMWDYERNKQRPDEVVYSSKKNYYWICENGHSFFKSPYRLLQGERCPYCKSRKIKADFNSLAAKNPELAKEWNNEKNGDLTPEEVMPNSTKKVWWRGVCGHEWQATVANRNSRGSGCPYCSGRKVLIGFNDFATLYPDIAAEWNYEKNEDISPTDFTSGSSKRVWWKCKCGHEWEASIDKRCLGRGCPICRKAKHNQR